MSKIKIFGLGGLNENGKNMYVVDVNGDLFVFDAGLKYSNGRSLGIDYIIPNFKFLKENKNRIKGIFLSHGHESNMGAVPDLLHDLKDINIYATKFTMEVLKQELTSQQVSSSVLKEIRPHSKISFGECSVFPISVSHSIPDAVCFVLYTPDGAIVYTGDFVFDSTMMGNYKTDIGKLAYVGKQGVLCLLSESIYAERPGHTSPFNRVEGFIRELFNRTNDRIIVTVLPAHIYRIQEIFNVVNESNRKIVFMGKVLKNLVEEAIKTNYLFIDNNKIGDLSDLNDKNTVVLISDEKEKPFANLDRIVKGFDKYIKLKETDTIFISEPSYEGVEKRLAVIMDDIAKNNVNVVSLSHKKHLLHHASREDLMLMLNLMNPKYYFPVKGEYRHQCFNAEVAEDIGIDKGNILLKQNGDVVTFDNGKLIDSFEKIEVDDVLIDGHNPTDIGEVVLKDREMLGENGIVIVSCTLNKQTKDILAGPEILTRGFVYVKENQEILVKTQEICFDIIKASIETDTKKVDYTKIKTEVRDKLGKFYYNQTESKPMIITVIQEV